MKRVITILVIIAAITAATTIMISQSKDPSEKPQKAIDPVCGLTVDKLDELSYTYKNETYYFCSKSDLNKFKVSPDKYVKKPTTGRS